MIHLDRNHHHLSPKSNLILQNDPLSWSQISRDDKHFQPLSTDKSLIHSNAVSPEPPTNGPITPADGSDPTLPATSPSSPLDPPTDPADNPQPQSTAPQPLDDDHASPLANASRSSTPLSELSTAPDQDDPTPENHSNVMPEEDGTSKSEEGPSADRDIAESGAVNPPTEMENRMAVGNVADSQARSPSPPKGSTIGPSSSQRPSDSTEPSPHSQHTTPEYPPPSDQHSTSTERGSQRVVAEERAPSRASNSSSASSKPPPQTNGPVATSPTAGHGAESKVMTILELNSELLKVSLEFQARGVAIADQRFAQYAQRLESNLRWLAAAHDQSGKANAVISLPSMQPPPPVEFLPMDRIQQLYGQLPTVFARDLARRQQHAAAMSHANSMSPPAAPSLKRDRAEDGRSSTDPSSKRRDTGEGKASSVPPSGSMLPPQIPPMSSSSTPNPSQQNHHRHIAPASATSPPRSHHSQSASPVVRPSSIRPSSSPTAMSPEEQRARQMHQQMRNSMQQQQQQQQQQHNLQQGVQQHQQPHPGGGMGHMSPRLTGPQAPQISRAPSLQNMPGAPTSLPGGPPPSNPTNPTNPNPAANLNPAQLATMQGFGPSAMQNYQILQNPSHPFMLYLVNAVPNFAQLTIQQQLQKMHQVQTVMMARQQQNQQAASGRPGAPMMGFGQAPNMSQQQALAGANMSGSSQFPGMNAASPASQQASAMSQHAQASQAGSSQFAPNAGMSHMAPGGSSGPTPQQPAGMTALNMNQLTPQQRQYLLMKQQEAMRSGGNSTINPAMMNAQMYAATQAAMRQGQASSSPHSADGRSPMLGAGESQSFPALRSNPSTIPGIARSNRSPSDNAQSPMTPRVPMRVPSAQQMHAQQSQSQDEYHRALLQAQQQAAARSGYINPQQLGQAGWPQQMAMAINQSQVQGHQGSYGMSPPGSAGPGGPSPTGINPSQTWSQNANHYPYAGSPSASAQQGRAPTPVRGASATPVPHGSPSGEQNGQEGFDLFNWG